MANLKEQEKDFITKILFDLDFNNLNKRESCMLVRAYIILVLDKEKSTITYEELEEKVNAILEGLGAKYLCTKNLVENALTGYIYAGISMALTKNGKNDIHIGVAEKLAKKYELDSAFCPHIITKSRNFKLSWWEIEINFNALRLPEFHEKVRKEVDMSTDVVAEKFNDILKRVASPIKGEAIAALNDLTYFSKYLGNFAETKAFELRHSSETVVDV